MGMAGIKRRKEMNGVERIKRESLREQQYKKDYIRALESSYQNGMKLVMLGKCESR